MKVIESYWKDAVAVFRDTKTVDATRRPWGFLGCFTILLTGISGIFVNNPPLSFSTALAHSRAGLETLCLVHEPNFLVINPRAKSGGFYDLRYTRIESTSADCPTRLADDIDTEGVRVTQQAGIPGEVRNLDQDVPWMLMVRFRIGRRRPTRSTTGHRHRSTL